MPPPAEEPTQDPLVGKVLAGRYRVERLLGVGGMGRVYDAVQVDLGRRVALKVLAPELAREPVLLERFRREAQAAGVLGNPHIVDVTDFAMPEGGPPFLVMEHLVGESLMDLLQREKRLSVRRAVRITVQLLDALQEAHDAGIVHRDLKPANIFMLSLAGGEEMVKLLDFGVAKLQESRAQRLTAVGALVGTPRFAAPEQLKGGEVDPRTDVYGAGVLLYGMLSGHPPFNAPLEDLIRSILEDDPPDVRVANPEVDPHLAEVVRRAMSKNPADRYASANAMLSALGGQRAKAGRITHIDEARDGPPRDRAPKKIQEQKGRARVPLLVALVPLALLGLVLALGTAVGVYYWASRDAGPGVVSPSGLGSTVQRTAECDGYVIAACACPDESREAVCAAARAQVADLRATVDADPAQAAGVDQWCHDAKREGDLCDPPDEGDDEDSVAATPPPPAVPLAAQSYRGTLDAGDWRRPGGGLTERFSFDLDEGERVEISMTSDDVDSALVLRGREDRVVAQNDDAEVDLLGNDARIVFMSPRGGSYVLEAGAARVGERGSYQLTVVRSGAHGHGRSRARTQETPAPGASPPGRPYAVPFPGAQPVAPAGGSVPPPWNGR